MTSTTGKNRSWLPARGVVLVSLLLGAAGSACGTTATITFKSPSQGYVEADIVGSDADNLILKTPSGRVTVRKDQVADIDHPGNVLAIAGAPFVVPGLLWLASPSFRCEGGGSHAFCTSLPFAAVLGGAGVATTIWGMVVYNKSTRAAGASTPPLTGAPVVWRDQGTRFLGGAMSFNY